jgi:hypothetical protein
VSSLLSEWQRPATMPAVELGGIGISVLSTDAGKPCQTSNDLDVAALARSATVTRNSRNGDTSLLR